MKIAVVLGAAKEPMQLRLEEALRGDYDKLVVSGRRYDPQSLDRDYIADELHCLDDRLEDAEYSEAFSTFGSYATVCNITDEDDQLTFIGHESHTQRMKVYQRHFGERDIENIFLPDPNLKPVYKTFDRFSAAVHDLGLKLIPETMKKQARDKNSFLNRYVIPVKNTILNKKN
ncbi:MAG: hypothetical protein ABH824_07665 [Nanoarchaeota archaeon]|nr:YdcF family protein [Nanoarchaeota archaeon]MBU1631642.1 YdcF family protein [Nanoarchaeota archaeon]MBU1875655.1 YdcF family protein [Nanoarchaeota archaeon]